MNSRNPYYGGGLILRLGGALLVCALVVTAVMFAPEAVVREMGNRLSPQGSISESFIPVWRRMLATAVALSAALGLLLWQLRRIILDALRHFAGVIRGEWPVFQTAVARNIKALSRVEWFALGIIMAVAIWIRWRYLMQPIAFDEATTVNLYASSPWYIAMANYSMPNNHILHTLLVRLALTMGGYGERVIRAPALVAGLLCLPAAYMYARLAYSRGAAIITAGWMSASLPFVYMSVNARGYTLVALCGIVAHIGIAQVALRSSYLAATIYALSLAIGLSAVPVALLYVLSTALWFLLYWAIVLRRGGSIEMSSLKLFVGALVVAGVLTLMMYLPALLLMGSGTILANQWVMPIPWPDFVEALPTQLAGFVRYNLDNYPWVMRLGVAVGCGSYLIFMRRVERIRGIPMAIVALVTCLSFLMLNSRFPLWGLAPIWMFLSVLLVGAFAGGADHLLRRLFKDPAAGYVVILIAMLLAIVPAYNLTREHPRQVISPLFSYLPDDIERLVRYLDHAVDDADKILLDDGAAMHHFYWRRLGRAYDPWNWDLSVAERVFVVTTDQPHPNHAPRMWRLLQAHGVEGTNDLVRMQDFSRSVIWRGDLGEP